MAISLQDAIRNNQSYMPKKPIPIIVKQNNTHIGIFECRLHKFRSINTDKCYECGVANNEKNK